MGPDMVRSFGLLNIVLISLNFLKLSPPECVILLEPSATGSTYPYHSPKSFLHSHCF